MSKLLEEVSPSARAATHKAETDTVDDHLLGVRASRHGKGEAVAYLEDIHLAYCVNTASVERGGDNTYQKQVASDELLVGRPDCLEFVADLANVGVEGEGCDEVAPQREEECHGSEDLEADELLQRGRDGLVDGHVGWVLGVLMVVTLGRTQCRWRAHGYNL